MSVELIFHCESSVSSDSVCLKSRCLPDEVDLEYPLHLGILLNDQSNGSVGVLVIILVFSAGITFLLKPSCICVVPLLLF